MPVISGITGLIGGIVGGNDSRNAGRTIGSAGTAASTAIGTAGNQAAKATNDATAAGQGLYGQAIGGIGDAVAAGQAGVTAGGQQATGRVNDAALQSNTVAGNLLGGQLQNLNPYLQTGAAGSTALQGYVNNPFKAPTAAEAEATPGFQFQMQQGLNGLTQQYGASGGAATGGALKALTQYGQGVASTYYQNAFNNALNSYGMNVNTAAGAAGQGLQASSQANQAAQNFGNIYNSNTMGAGYYGGNTAQNVAQENAGLGMQGAGTQANLLSGEAGFGLNGAITAGNQNMQGTQAAGNFFMQGANGVAAGQQGQANALSSGISSFGNMFNPMGSLASPSTWLGFGSGNNPYFGGGSTGSGVMSSLPPMQPAYGGGGNPGYGWQPGQSTGWTSGAYQG